MATYLLVDACHVFRGCLRGPMPTIAAACASCVCLKLVWTHEQSKQSNTIVLSGVLTQRCRDDKKTASTLSWTLGIATGTVIRVRGVIAVYLVLFIDTE